MSPLVKNILAVVAGIVIGGFINYGIIMISGGIIPPPAGVDPSDMESIRAGAHLFQPKHYIMPFLAHALGTLIGAIVTAKMAASNNIKLAMIIGLFFLIGGVSAAFMIPAPSWFIALDLIVAYIPAAWLGGKLAAKM